MSDVPKTIQAWVNNDGSTQFAGDKLFPKGVEVKYIRKDLSDGKDKQIEELGTKLAKALRLMELSVELATWNTALLDDVIFFITELKETDQ